MELQLHTLLPTTILLHIWLEMERSTWATYQLLRCSPTALWSHCRSQCSWRSVLQWKWSELDLEMAWKMTTGLELLMASEMILQIVSEMQMASEMESESKLIGHVSFQEIGDVWLCPLFLCLRFFVWIGHYRRPGGVLSWLEVYISLCQGPWRNLPLL